MKRRRVNKRSFIARMMDGTCLVVAILAIVSFVSPWIPPDRISLASISSLAIPISLPGVLLCLIYTLLNKRWKLLPIILLAMFLGGMHLGKLVQLPKTISSESIANNSISVLTYNLRLLYSLDEKDLDIERFCNNLNGLDADILCLQEVPVSKTTKEALNNCLSSLGYTFRLAEDELHQLDIFSKLPIAKHGMVFISENNINGCVYADISLNDERSFRLYNAHFESNNRLYQENALSAQLNKKNTSKNLIDHGMYTIKSYKLGAQLRSGQVRLVANHIASGNRPVIVAGDFNDVSHSYAYHMLSKSLKDAFREAGQGWGQTYRGNIPGLRIDYVMTTDDFNVIKYQRHCLPYSDHCAVKAQIVF